MASGEASTGAQPIALVRSRTRHILYLSYRAPPVEAGPEKPFDLSRQTVNDRWRSGELDMACALGELAEPGGAQAKACALTVVRRRAGGTER